MVSLCGIFFEITVPAISSWVLIWDLRVLHNLQYTKVSTASSDKSINGSTTKNELKSSGNIAI
jgi:hypothetical protein